MTDIRMIFSDMDGTMLNSNGQISQRTVEAVRAAQKKGVIVAVCSGRFPQFISYKMNELGLQCPIAGLNGAVLWDDEKRCISAVHPMKTASAQMISEICYAHSAHFFAFFDDCIVTSSFDRPHPYVNWRGGVFERDYGMRFGSGKDAVQNEITTKETIKFVIRLDQVEDRRKLREELMQVPDVCLTSSAANNIEIMRTGIDKQFGIESLSRWHGIDIQHAMAIGDYHNDIPMLRAAGVGVAMGNAAEEVKACADFVTDTNNNDGVAKAIEKFILNL